MSICHNRRALQGAIVPNQSTLEHSRTSGSRWPVATARCCPCPRLVEERPGQVLLARRRAAVEAGEGRPSSSSTLATIQEAVSLSVLLILQQATGVNSHFGLISCFLPSHL
ncbi:hypothetical protein [Thermogemmatispora carboxidivorans]|uniref:hypothetical protein n=1 Tax=Thermogemmatispora carboxidivorans TaxID=1382306 RepID=UPI0012DCD5B5|nr:hypothetical protein [Thermogemmatispora carboxidivorans]